MPPIPTLEELSRYRPFQNRVMVRVDTAPERTAGGLYIPEEYIRTPFTADVLAIGNGYKAQDGEAPLELAVAVGDRALVGKWTLLAHEAFSRKIFFLPDQLMLAKITGPNPLGDPLADVEPLGSRMLIEILEEEAPSSIIVAPETRTRVNKPRFVRVLKVGPGGWEPARAEYTDGIVREWRRRREPMEFAAGDLAVLQKWVISYDEERDEWRVGDGNTSFVFPGERYMLVDTRHLVGDVAFDQ
ncbi:MAG: hypothetical protein M3O61_18620 [Gemmatimonadota bacterium]|nr:hypothetical protein [Gemmatimonadota bacterium]